MPTTRLDLFYGIADHLGELIIVTATDDASDNRTFKSATEFTVQDQALAGRGAWYVSSGSPDSANNVETARRVQAVNSSTNTLTVDADWPSPAKAGDVLALVNWHGYSVRIDEIHRKINTLIERVSDEMAAPVTGSETTFDALSPTIAYPEAWDWVLGCQWQDRLGVWHPVYVKDLEFQPWDRTVQIMNVPRRKLSRYPVRLIGAINLPPLERDSDETVAPKAWLCLQAAAELKREGALRQGNTPTHLTIANMMLADAQALRDSTLRQYRIEGGFRWSTRR